jgi:hypothetical protein
VWGLESKISEKVLEVEQVKDGFSLIFYGRLCYQRLELFYDPLQLVIIESLSSLCSTRGEKKVPELAKSLGRVKREFEEVKEEKKD